MTIFRNISKLRPNLQILFPKRDWKKRDSKTRFRWKSLFYHSLISLLVFIPIAKKEKLIINRYQMYDNETVIKESMSCTRADGVFLRFTCIYSLYKYLFLQNVNKTWIHLTICCIIVQNLSASRFVSFYSRFVICTH